MPPISTATPAWPAIASRAARLGDDAVLPFLDELVMWLALSVHGREFFRLSGMIKYDVDYE